MVSKRYVALSANDDAGEESLQSLPRTITGLLWHSEGEELLELLFSVQSSSSNISGCSGFGTILISVKCFPSTTLWLFLLLQSYLVP